MNTKTFCDLRNTVSTTGFKTLGTLAAALFLCGWLFAPSAIASIYTLAPSGNITASPSGFPTGGTLVGSNAFAFSSGTLDGNILSLVYQGDPSNPYGGLTFTYSVALNPSSLDSLSELTVGSYAGFSTDVSYNSSGGAAPSNFSRTSGSGDTLHFFFSNSNGGILPGQPGDTIVVQTGASNFQTAMGGVIDSIPANVSVLAPVPEPAIGSLLVTGLGMLFFRRRASK
jgi:hypothetical protein